MKKLALSDSDTAQLDRMTRDRVGLGTLERYTGSEAAEFQPYILLTNFERYVHAFAGRFGVELRRGSVMQACHAPRRRLSIVDVGVGSPTAALIVELLSFVRPNAVLLLGMCGGLRDSYRVGDFFNPVAAIRDEGTSDFFLPPACPALASFPIQRYVCRELERRELVYHSGVIHTTNVRFWEFDEAFRARLHEERAQAIDMECATLFTAAYARQIALGALMLISDLPLSVGGVKTKESARSVFEKHTAIHVDTGIAILDELQEKNVNVFGLRP
ncbi:MAG: AMP nucleosidase [Vicinamibacteria bacterium]|jgi:AMP nucleosidase|nr:AMP nucleosidase [Vicinamibacteria bacterium]